MLKSKKQFKISLISLLLIFIIVSFGVFVFGQAALAADCSGCNDICLQISIPGIGNCVKGFPQYVEAIYNMFIGIVGILAVIMIMAGGFQWLLAAGNAQRIAGAKTTIISAVMGLVLALTSFTILSWINPELTNLDLQLRQKVKEQEWGSFCRVGTVFVPKKGENKPRCGIFYELKADQANCWGASCDYMKNSGRRVCIQRKSTKPGQINASCADNVMIKDEEFGYGLNTWDVVTGSVKGKGMCGELLYRKTADKVNRYVGQGCSDGRSCVIDENGGVNFTMTESEVPGDGASRSVGIFRVRHCY